MITLETQITDAEIDLEAVVALGATPAVMSRRLPPLCAGHLVLLDVLRSPFVGHGHSMQREHVAEALAVLLAGPKAPFPVFGHITGAPGVWAKYRREAAKLVTVDNWQTLGNQIAALIDTGQNGFEMITSTGKGGGGGRLDIAWLAGLLVGCDGLVSWRDLLWKMPFVMVGHVIAQRAASMQHKVHRPIDMAGAMAQLQSEMTGANDGA